MRIFSVLFLFFAMRNCHLSSYKVRLRVPFAHSEAFFPIPFKNSCKKTRIEFFYSPLNIIKELLCRFGKEHSLQLGYPQHGEPPLHPCRLSRRTHRGTQY